LKNAGLFTCNRFRRKSENRQPKYKTSAIPCWASFNNLPRGRGLVSGVSIRPVPRGYLLVKHSRKSRSITSWVSISSWDGAEFTIVPGRHPCPREIPQRTSAVIGGL